MMDFTISREIADLRDRISAFVDEHLIPLEADPAAYDDHENIAAEPRPTPSSSSQPAMPPVSRTRYCVPVARRRHSSKAPK